MAKSNGRTKKHIEIDVDITEDFPVSPQQLLSKFKSTLKCKSENQKKFINLTDNHEIVICSGLPGTGKTYLSCHQALSQLKNNDKYQKIVIVKSVTTLKDEELGFLKGNLMEKMEPFVYSFINNFEKLIGKELTARLISSGVIEVLPIAYMRGINIDNAIIIIDEVQNINISNIRTILTRLGFNSKMLLLGDVNQIDMRNKKDSSLKFLLEKFADVPQVGTIQLGVKDIVRNPLIEVIEKIFENFN